MNTLKLKTLVFALVLIAHQSIYGQSNAPKYSNEFLTIGVDARALGMASAFTAVSNDVYAGYWNPAGLNALTDKYEVGLQHSQYFAGIANYDYIGFATQIDSVSSLGISAIRLGVDDIPDTRYLYDANGALNYDNITFFSSADYAFIFSYARKLKVLGGINAGANAKVIYRTVGSFANAWGYGLDLGLNKSFNNLNVAIMLKDVTGTYNSWNHNTSLIADIYTQTGNIIPENSIEITLPRAIAGVSYTYSIKELLSFLISLDLDATFDGERNTLIKSSILSIDPKLGLEVGYVNKFFLRLGIGQFQEIQNWDRSTTTVFQPNFGLGVHLNVFSLDYAMSNVRNEAETPYSHILSLKIRFNDKN